MPAPLPPDPAVLLEGPLQALHERALLSCGRLDGVSSLLTDPELFLYAYVRREALLSSQIEGTQSSLSDLLLFELEEAPGAPLDDVVEVSSYVAGWNMDWHGCGMASPSPPACCGRSTHYCSPAAAEPIGCPGSSAVVRIGSVVPDPATPASCLPPGTWGVVHGPTGALHPCHN